MKTYTKSELVQACGDFYRIAEPRWLRRAEQWTDLGILLADEETSQGPQGEHGPGRYRRYPEQEIYVAALLFRIKAVGFQLSTIKTTSWLLHGLWPDREQEVEQVKNSIEMRKVTGDQAQKQIDELEKTAKVGLERIRAFWEAAKGDVWDEKRWGGPATLTLILVPDTGKGFRPGELEVLLRWGANPPIPKGCESIAFDLHRIFAATRVRLPRPISFTAKDNLQQIMVAG